MAIIGSQIVVAYATSTTLRISTASALSIYPSIFPQIFRPSLCWPRASITAVPSKVIMAAASTSANHADPELDIASNISSVKRRISDAISSNDRPEGSVRLVAVSKTKPLEFLQVAYEVRNTKVQ